MNQPLPITVVTRSESDDESEPIALIFRGRHYQVERIEDQWRIEEEWWREHPINRHYYRLVLTGEIVSIVYRDCVENVWYTQHV